MRRKASFWITLYVAFMIGYFLLLTVILPSAFAYDPDWIKVGSYAEYNVENGALNGIYAWRVIAIENRMATVNETFQGTTHWDHVADNVIPPGGRTTEISAGTGTIEDLILWLKRYYNEILLDHTVILGVPEHVWWLTGEREMPFQEQTRQILHLEASEGWQWSRSADYDKATGILMRYSWTWPRLGTVYVTLKSTNVFNSTMNGPSFFPDLLAITPLFILPLIGALKGLSMIRRGGFDSSRRFWLGIILLNGGLIAIFSDFPFNGTLLFSSLIQPGMPPIIGLFALALFLINVAFWTGILAAAILIVLIVNRFMFPVTTKSQD